VGVDRCPPGWGWRKTSTLIFFVASFTNSVFQWGSMQNQPFGLLNSCVSYREHRFFCYFSVKIFIIFLYFTLNQETWDRFVLTFAKVSRNVLFFDSANFAAGIFRKWSRRATPATTCGKHRTSNRHDPLNYTSASFPLAWRCYVITSRLHSCTNYC